MPEFTTILIKREEVAEGTMAFYFEKPKEFDFTAGQNGDFTLINPPKTDGEGDTRTFTIASAPYEENLMIATRIRESAFKQVIKDLPVGTKVRLKGPYGDFVLHNNTDNPAVFLTGGIGITTARSIISQATKEKLPHKITLLYSNKTPTDAAFLDDLNSYAKDNPNFTFVPVMTRTTAQEWSGESGHIARDMLKKYLKDLGKPIYYLSGPNDMVTAMRGILAEARVNQDNIRTEEYTGY